MKDTSGKTGVGRRIARRVAGAAIVLVVLALFIAIPKYLNRNASYNEYIPPFSVDRYLQCDGVTQMDDAPAYGEIPDAAVAESCAMTYWYGDDPDFHAVEYAAKYACHVYYDRENTAWLIEERRLRPVGFQESMPSSREMGRGILVDQENGRVIALRDRVSADYPEG